MSVLTISGRTLGRGCALLWCAATATLSAVGCGSDTKGGDGSGGVSMNSGSGGKGAQGGAPSGGTASTQSGGQSSGGAQQGGAANGGAANGGASTSIPKGGTANGGAAQGGAAQGGASSSSKGGGSNGPKGGATSNSGGATNGAGGATSASGGATSGSGGSSTATGCDAPNLVWKTANKTNYTSYPDPGSEECVKFNGCTWAGQFAACDDKKPEQWVSTHNIVAAFPDFNTLKLHDLCLRKGTKTIVVTVLDTCGDSDCSGCCTENRGNADQLIDIESYTNARWGVPDGAIEWADLGPTKGTGCN